MNSDSILTDDGPGSGDHLHLIAKLLHSPHKAEAKNWLDGSQPSCQRTIGLFKGAHRSLKVVKELYEAGAVKIFAVDIKTQPNGSQRTNKLVMELPADTKLRDAIFRWCKKQGDKAGYSPESDAGEKHMYLLLA